MEEKQKFEEPPKGGVFKEDLGKGKVVLVPISKDIIDDIEKKSGKSVYEYINTTLRKGLE